MQQFLICFCIKIYFLFVINIQWEKNGQFIKIDLHVCFDHGPEIQTSKVCKYVAGNDITFGPHCHLFPHMHFVVWHKVIISVYVSTWFNMGLVECIVTNCNFNNKKYPVCKIYIYIYTHTHTFFLCSFNLPMHVWFSSCRAINY